MPGRETGTWMHGPMRFPTFDSARRSTIHRIREEFKACCEGSGRDAHVSAALLAKHLHGLAEVEQKEAGFGMMALKDKQVVALRVCQLMQDMDLRNNGQVGLEEWMHYMLLEEARIPSLKVSLQITKLLRAALRQYPRLLEDLQRMFWAADASNEGTLCLSDVTEMYRRRLWHFSPTNPRGLITEADWATRNPEDLARQIMDAMDLNGSSYLSYAEFIAYCLGRRKQPVTLHFYDLTNGAASAISPWVLGHKLDGLWHTGVEVYGKEYYFGGDIFFDTPAATAFGEPLKRTSLGFTLWRQEELHNYIVDELRPMFNRDVYDVVFNNCNHFADRICVWLTGMHIPEEVVHQPESLMQLRVARVMRPLLNRWLGNLESNSEKAGEAKKDDDTSASLPRPGLPHAAKPALAPGSLVSIRLVMVEEKTFGITVAPPQGHDALQQQQQQQQQQQPCCWVRYLKMHGLGAKGNSRVSVCTDLVELERLQRIDLGELNTDATYLTALRAMISQSVLCLMSKQKEDGEPCFRGGASCGLKPTMSVSPGSMFEDEGMQIVPFDGGDDTPTVSPSPSPRHSGPSADGTERALDDLSVPVEGRLRFEHAGFCGRRRLQGPRPGISRGPRRTELDLHRRGNRPPSRPKEHDPAEEPPPPDMSEEGHSL
jgi:hypothetical protein